MGAGRAPRPVPPHLPHRVSTSWKGRLPGFWTPSPALSVLCQCSDLSLPSPHRTVHPSESLLPGPPSVHVPMAQPWEEDLGAYMRFCEGLLSPWDSADVADLPRTSSHTKLGPAFPEGLQRSRSQVCLPLAPPCPSSAFFLRCCQENNTTVRDVSWVMPERGWGKDISKWNGWGVDSRCFAFSCISPGSNTESWGLRWVRSLGMPARVAGVKTSFGPAQHGQGSESQTL